MANINIKIPHVSDEQFAAIKEDIYQKSHALGAKLGTDSDANKDGRFDARDIRVLIDPKIITRYTAKLTKAIESGNAQEEAALRKGLQGVLNTVNGHAHALTHGTLEQFDRALAELYPEEAAAFKQAAEQLAKQAEGKIAFTPEQIKELERVAEKGMEIIDTLKEGYQAGVRSAFPKGLNTSITIEQVIPASAHTKEKHKRESDLFGEDGPFKASSLLKGSRIKATEAHPTADFAAERTSPPANQAAPKGNAIT